MTTNLACLWWAEQAVVLAAIAYAPPVAATQPSQRRPRDAIAVRLELNLTSAPDPAIVAGLAVLQRLGAQPAPISFLQLTRAQLAELIEALAGQPVFFG